MGIAGLNNIKSNTIHDNEYGIYLYRTEDNNISYNNISSNDYDGIYFTGAVKPDDVYDNIITWNGHAGINCTSASDPTIKSNDIENNTRNGVWSEGGSDPVINYNNICNNGGSASGDGYGVYNDDGNIEIDAHNNWWGHETGPHHPIYNPDGQGDKVSNDVDFEPFSDHPF